MQVIASGRDLLLLMKNEVTLIGNSLTRRAVDPQCSGLTQGTI
jgi:hypothetical protein